MKTRASKRTGGFTLVELIVVIAILAILAGVGTVAYGGYIKKANKAADDALLGAVNTAFAAACVENGVDAVKILDATLAYTADAEGAEISGIASIALPDGSAAAADDIKPSFDKYFAGNSGALKYYEQGDIQFYEGVFTGDPTVILTKAVANYKASNFNGNEAQLLTSVDNVTRTFAEFLGESGSISDRMNALTIFSGFDKGAFIAKYGLTDESTNQAIANALVLESASRAKNVDPYTLYDAVMKTGTLPTGSDPIATLPLAYGLVTAYASSGYASDDFVAYYSTADLSAGLNDDPGDTDSLMTLFTKFMAEKDVVSADGSKGLVPYMTSDGLDDINGYLGAMTAIDQNAGSVNINAENAFNDPEVLKLIQAILGSGN